LVKKQESEPLVKEKKNFILELAHLDKKAKKLQLFRKKKEVKNVVRRKKRQDNQFCCA